MKRALLLQLPVPQFSWPYVEANVPLAAGYLASWVRSRLPGWHVDILPWHEADVLGDEALLEAVLSRDPDLVGMSLYLWNAERSLYLARRLTGAGVPVVFGGPEVSSDNTWLWEQNGFGGAAVAGEGEGAFACVLRELPSGATRPRSAPPVDLSGLESPYLTGILSPYPDGTVWIETVRGCPFRCAYCNYGKRHAGVRAFPSGWLRAHLEWAARSGASEVYLMDPSFNVRRDWDRVLSTLEEANAGGALTYHTELVADALRPGDAKRLADAGLKSCEVGLQSIHADVLSAVGRRWDPSRWVRGVRELADAGISLEVGLIVGLPGDSPERFEQTLGFVLSAVPAAQLQVFPLALLPGTELREQAKELGLEALGRPPYTVFRTPLYTPEDMCGAFNRFEEATGQELDPMPPPSMSGPWNEGEGAPYLTGVRLDARRSSPDWVEPVARRAARNFTLWVQGWREDLPGQVRRLVDRLPHGTFTVLLEDGAGWPPGRLQQLLAAGTGEHYLDRHLSHLYGPSSRLVPRLAALVEDMAPGATPEWVAQIRTLADVVWMVDVGQGSLGRAVGLAQEGETVYARGRVRQGDLQDLAATLGADARGLVFGHAEDQRAWELATGTGGFRVPEYWRTVP